MSNPSSEQMTHLLRLVLESKISRHQLQILINSGLLSDLLHTNPGNINREGFRRMVGLEPLCFPVMLGGTETVDQIVYTLKSVGITVDDRVNGETISLPSRREKDEDMVLTGGSSLKKGKPPANLEEWQSVLEDQGLQIPTIEHALKFVLEYEDREFNPKDPMIIFPHEPWEDESQKPHVLALLTSPKKFLTLISATEMPHFHFRIAGVKREEVESEKTAPAFLAEEARI